MRVIETYVLRVKATCSNFEELRRNHFRPAECEASPGLYIIIFQKLFGKSLGIAMKFFLVVFAIQFARIALVVRGDRLPAGLEKRQNGVGNGEDDSCQGVDVCQSNSAVIILSTTTCEGTECGSPTGTSSTIMTSSHPTGTSTTPLRSTTQIIATTAKNDVISGGNRVRMFSIVHTLIGFVIIMAKMVSWD
jgi:hypothetical protein